MQAIRTRKIGPTDTKGSRIQAKGEATTIYVPYDYALDLEENHKTAAKIYCDRMKWQYRHDCGVFAHDYYHVVRS